MQREELAWGYSDSAEVDPIPASSGGWRVSERDYIQ